MLRSLLSRTVISKIRCKTRLNTLNEQVWPYFMFSSICAGESCLSQRGVKGGLTLVKEHDTYIGCLWMIVCITLASWLNYRETFQITCSFRSIISAFAALMLPILPLQNNKDYLDQSLDEIKLLKYVNEHDPRDEKGILQLFDYFYYKASVSGLGGCNV